MASPPSTATGQRLGRFELRRELGRGAQATVWLAFDPRLEREVAVKLMHDDAAADPLSVDQWLREARAVSRLTHANIVPVFEADVHGRRPYLVFEYVPGQTLSQHLQTRGPLAPHDGVAMMLGVLEALSAAHGAGVVHRDLKPSNILVDETGRARVMDFGIAARLNDSGSLDQIVGTPGYMSPEAANGGLPSAAMDVFSAGLVLIEMLSGERLIRERDPYRAMHRVGQEDLSLPPGLPVAADDGLRTTLRRAIERDPLRRWPDASAFRDALRQWLVPAATTTDTARSNVDGATATLEFLLRRMRHKTDFPALSDSVSRIQRFAESESASIGGLSSEILKDVALTNKLLRLVNTAHYSGAGGNVSTVSRAIALIGFAGVRNLAMSLVLLEHMQDKAHANQLKENFLRSLMAGMLASEFAAASRHTEEAFIGAMFQNLGRMLSEFYFPEEAHRVRGVLAAAATGPFAKDEESAAVEVLGISYRDLGLGVARSWDLPDGLQACMRKPSGEPPTRVPADADERMRWLTFAANQITDAILQTDPAHAKAKISALAKTFSRSLGLSVETVESSALAAQKRLAQMAQAMNLTVHPRSPTRRLLQTSTHASAPTRPLDSSGQHGLHAASTAVLPPRQTALDTASEVLAAGIQNITNSMVENFRLNDVLRMILETMFRALAFQRIVFCLRDAKKDALTGRFGLGEGVDAVVACFHVPLKGNSHLFSAVCVKGADTLISDARASSIASRMPPWYLKEVNAPAFLLLPMLLKGAPFALIYADKAHPETIEMGEKELSLVRTLRNQAVMAFKQSS